MTLLNNSSVAAFLGAFFAFMLVAANDWRRRRRSKREILFLVSDNADHARAKLQTVTNKLELLQQANKVSPGRIMAFPTDALKSKQLEVIDLLNSNENRGLSALLHWMAGIDELLDEHLQTTKLLSRTPASGADSAEIRLRLGHQMVDELKDIGRNLGYLIMMCDWFTSGQPHKIFEMQIPIFTSGEDA